MSFGRRGIDREFERTLEESKRVTDEDKEFDADLQRAIELSKIDFASASNPISDDESADKPHKFQTFFKVTEEVQTPVDLFNDSLIIDKKIDSPGDLFSVSPNVSKKSGDISVDSLNEEKMDVVVATPESDSADAATALKYCNFPSNTAANLENVDWTTSDGENTKDSVGRVMGVYKRHYRWINDQRILSHEDTTWITYKEGETLGNKKRNVIQGQLATWYVQYYPNGVPDDAKKYLADRRKRLKDQQVSTNIAVATPIAADEPSLLDVFAPDSASSSASNQSPVMSKWCQAPNNRIESDSSPNTSYIGQESVSTPFPVTGGRGAFQRLLPMAVGASPTLTIGRGSINPPPIGRVCNYRPAAPFGRGQRITKTLYNDENPSDFDEIKNQMGGRDDVDELEGSDEEWHISGSKKKSAKQKAPAKPRGAVKAATTDRRGGRQSKQNSTSERGGVFEFSDDNP